MRSLLLAALLCTAAGAQAGDARFDLRKALTLRALAERQHVLEQETACVQQARDEPALVACAAEARAQREAMGRRLRHAAAVLKR